MHWIAVTNMRNRRIFINLDHVSAIIPSGDSTKVFFAGSETDQIDVKESADDIFGKDTYALGRGI